MQYDTDADCGDALTERVGCQKQLQALRPVLMQHAA